VYQNVGCLAVRSFVLVLVGLVVSGGCAPNPTQEDSRRIIALRKQYESSFEFNPGTDVYLKVRRHVGGSLPESEALAVARDFWATQSGMRRTNSNYIYLNFYDRTGLFLFQVYWDPARNEYRVSHKEYY
jgi:hypothetical protein